jgi:hypothetical protein
MAAPTWLGATTGQLPASGQVNNFLVTHPSTLIYTGADQNQQVTAGSGAADSNSLYVAQSFTTSATYTTGRIVLTLAVTGTPVPWSVTIQSNSSSAPSGTVLAGPVVIPHDYLSGSATAVSIPLPGGALATSTAYWIVAAPAGDGSDFFAWSKSNQTSGASTSTNGTSWTAQTYGLLFQVWDSTAAVPLLHTWEDSGARWTSWQSSANIPTGLQEYTVAQGTNQYVYSGRTISYYSPNVVSTIL